MLGAAVVRLVSINVISLRRARLVLGWVTVRGLKSSLHHLGIQSTTQVWLGMAIPQAWAKYVAAIRWGVNRHSRLVSVASQCKLVSGWRLRQQRSAPIGRPMWLSKGLYFLTLVTTESSSPVVALPCDGRQLRVVVFCGGLKTRCGREWGGSLSAVQSHTSPANASTSTSKASALGATAAAALESIVCGTGGRSGGLLHSDQVSDERRRRGAAAAAAVDVTAMT